MSAMTAAPPRRQGPPPEEAARALAGLVRETVASGTARQAVLLRLSLLPRSLSQPHHRRLALEALEPLTGADRARLFELPSGDAVVVWRGLAPAAVAESRGLLEQLFTDYDDAGGSVPEGLLRHLGLPEEAETLLDAAAAGPPAPVAAMPAAPRVPLDPAGLAALEEALGSADLSRFARRRPVCRAVPGRGLQLAWETRVLSLTELAETLAPGRDLEAAPWLFRRLSRLLDLRMMALLAAAGELDQAGPFALRLNVASVLSPAFLRFDAALPTRLRGEVVIVLRPEDTLADPPAFVFARGFAQARGFKLLLGGLAPALVPAFPVDAGGFDLLELVWEEALAGTKLEALGVAPERVVLAGVDTMPALDWARAQGIALVTGRLARPG